MGIFSSTEGCNTLAHHEMSRTLPLPLVGDIMASFTISKETFNNFLTSFGRDLSDIAIDVNADNISAAVANSTHYIYRKVDCGTESKGKLYITDIVKLKSFLSTVKVADLYLSQEGKTGTLHIRAGNSSLQLPTSSYVESQKRLGLLNKTIKQSKESMWTTWFNTPLTHHARVSAESLKPATGFKKVLGGKFACKTEFDSDGEEFIIRGGKSQTGKMFVRAKLSNVDAPSSLARSAFDDWLPELLFNLPVGELDLHTGDETVLILEQVSTNFLMIVIDQEYEED